MDPIMDLYLQDVIGECFDSPTFTILPPAARLN